MDVRQWSATPPWMDLHGSDNLGELLAPCPPGKSGRDDLRIEADHSEVRSELDVGEREGLDPALLEP